MGTKEGPARNLELEIRRVLIRGAMEDTVLWLRVNPSADERVYMLAMQPKLQELDTIVTHQIKGWTLPRDEKFSQVAGQVLLLLQKAREARGCIVGQNLGRLADCLAPSIKRKRSADSKTTNGAAATGRNIDTLRKECGWSFDELAEATGIDKKSILSHVNKGARPIPRILKEYAQAFSKALGRKITAPDLEK
jgi:DNA-binding XRE family transcriptional regulator